LVQRLMQNQRGGVSVQTAPELGSTFTLHVPMVT
jgi:chemotaxis protein histidine kinase CheA